MTRLSILTAGAKLRADAVKTAMAIVNPVQGQSGIYDIVDDAGGTFKAYVDMVTDGGYWIQLLRWSAGVAAAGVRTPNQLILKDAAVSGFSVDAVNYPSIPAGKFGKNIAKEWLFQDANATWISLYGAWQRGQLFAAGKTQIDSGEAIPVVTPLGNKNLYGVRGAWYLPTYMNEIFGFWTTTGPGGPCGGSNTSGSNRICPVFDTGAYTAHADYTSMKRLSLRASNYPTAS